MPAFYAVVITDAATDGEIAVSPYEARFLYNNNTSPATVNFSSVYGKGLSGGVAGTQVGFTVELRNKYNVPQARPALSCLGM